MKSIIKLRAIAALFVALSLFITYTHSFLAGCVVFAALGLTLEPYINRPRGILRVYTGVTLAEIFIPAVYASIQPNDSPEKTAFAESGVAVTNPLLQEAAQSGARKVEVPLWNDLDASSAPNLSDDTDTVATPGKVATSYLDARNAFINKGFGTADLATEIAKSTPGNGDPMTRIRNRYGKYWARQFQYRIIAAAQGVYANNIAATDAYHTQNDMVTMAALETTVGQAAANMMSPSNIIDAVFTLGDSFDALSAIAMHSIQYKTLVKLELISFIPSSEGTLTIPTYLGKRVIVDDGLPVRAGTTSGFVYTAILFGQAAIGYGEGTPPVPIELFREPKGGNGGGLESLWERKTWMIHPFGMHWLDASVAGASATLAELRLAANWRRILPRKNVPMAFLLTNG